eukprot:TRINITY_DN18337_c0_g2_i13.p1 TRINITY_DN18337_c0_g2~~TRINITY_DN18337_c0_g2_i13.p1  ORF type:complete len:793 (+),score=103.57 TRINITY_DN18337_c0_g2_i13:139-2517(+)
MLRSLVGSEMCIRDRVSTQSTGRPIRSTMAGMQSLRTWLISISLPQYAEAFRANGYDDLQYLVEDDTSITGLTRERLMSVGLASGHATKCLRELRELRQRGGKIKDVVGTVPKQTVRSPRQEQSQRSGGTRKPQSPMVPPVPKPRPTRLSPSCSGELAELVDKAFYTVEETKLLGLGVRLMVADNQGRWAAARVIHHDKIANSLTVQWTAAEWADQTFEVDYDHDFRLSKCKTPEAAYESSVELKGVLQEQRRKIAENLASQRAENLAKIELERAAMARMAVGHRESMSKLASQSGAVVVPQQPETQGDEDLEEVIDQMAQETFYSESEARELAIGAKIVIADNQQQWADAIVTGHSEDELLVEWTGPWAGQKYKRRYDGDYKFSKAATPSQAHMDARKLRDKIQGRTSKPAFTIVKSAIGCHVSCTSIRKVARGEYKANGKILCDCHKREMACADFALECAENKAKRPYESVEVETAYGKFSLAELRDQENGVVEVHPQRQAMRNKRLLDQVRSQSKNSELSQQASRVTHKDLATARTHLTSPGAVAPFKKERSTRRRQSTVTTPAPVPRVPPAKQERSKKKRKRTATTSPAPVQGVPRKQDKTVSVSSGTERRRKRGKGTEPAPSTKPVAPKIEEERSEWVQCEMSASNNRMCGKWRRITPSQLTALGSAAFACAMNTDQKYNRCRIKQEFPDDQIDQMLAERWGEESGNKTETDAKDATIVTAVSSVYEDYIGTQVMVPFKGYEGKHLGVVETWLPGQEQFDVKFTLEDRPLWLLMKYSAVIAHRHTDS